MLIRPGHIASSQKEAQGPGAQLIGADGKKPDFEMSLPVPSIWICMAIHFCHSCIFNLQIKILLHFPNANVATTYPRDDIQTNPIGVFDRVSCNRDHTKHPHNQTSCNKNSKSHMRPRHQRSSL
jgi:hypothetical protein